MAAAAMTIGDLARATATKVETIRYYERIGLLIAPQRTPGNYRSYSSQDLKRLSFIRRSRDLGFSIDQVRKLLDLADQQERSCEAVDLVALQHVTEIDRKIRDLQALRTELERMLKECQGGTIAECRIIEALSPLNDRD